ncbi:MAG: hypothetical protein CMO55_21980 [Verrucomicrobiales bacterium]|nr:hypothetical protein [Verrucomicrobiales bacterium]
MNENDEKALIALLAFRMRLCSEADLNRKDIEKLLSETCKVSDEERAFFESTDPLELIRKADAEEKIISFPKTLPPADFLLASGFNRGGHSKESEVSKNESVEKKREEIRKSLQENKGDSDEQSNND